MKSILNYLKNHVKKSHIILIITGLLFIIVGTLSWNLYFSKYYIFSKNEIVFEDAVKNYYKYHSIYLPKNGMVKTMTLKELYEGNHIETLYSPNKDRLCDTDSWVKVYNDNGNYTYYTYLKCGKYESQVDHTGPEITLNGDSTVYVSLDYDYNELGVKEVVDDKDGKIDIKNVTIDNSKVNTKKVGKYSVTYTVRDKLNNETKVTRTVIVARNLTDTVKKQVGENGYYQGSVNNNYLLFSGMMYRIINVNSDGTIKLISNEILNNLRADHETYENSNIDKYLNDVYLNIIHDQSYLVDTEFCVGNMTSRDDLTGACSTKVTRKVGLLDASSYNSSFKDNKSYLCSNYTYTLGNKLNGEILASGNGVENCTVVLGNDTLPSIRPVITLKSNLIISSGSGTKDNPYKLEDYSYGKTQDKINTRLIGEYINYSGMVFRIINIDEDKNVKMIAINGMSINSADATDKLLSLTIPTVDKYIFNITDENNPGYILNNNYIDYINDNYIVKKKYNIPINETKKIYSEYKSAGTVNAKIVLPTTYDLFSGTQTTNNTTLCLYLDSSTTDNNIFFLNAFMGRTFESETNKTIKYSYKPVITIKGDLTIKSGKGTITNPYYIR